MSLVYNKRTTSIIGKDSVDETVKYDDFVTCQNVQEKGNDIAELVYKKSQTGQLASLIRTLTMHETVKYDDTISCQNVTVTFS